MNESIKKKVTVEGLRKTTQSLMIGRPQGRESNPGFKEYEELNRDCRYREYLKIRGLN